jgi:hypothetical protein
MYVIGHNHPLVQLHVTNVIRDAFPVVANHLPELAQAHPTIYDLAQQAFPAVQADGDETGAGRRIIVAPSKITLKAQRRCC